MANAERLRQLRRVIENVPEDRLHMRNFFEQASCGTAYCAAGWFALDDWARANTEIGEILEVVETADYDLILRCTPTFEESKDWGMLAGLFDIDERDADNLFGAELNGRGDSHAVTKEDVIRNIDLLLNGEHAEEYAACRDHEED